MADTGLALGQLGGFLYMQTAVFAYCLISVEN